jgi:hypothetical protein
MTIRDVSAELEQVTASDTTLYTCDTNAKSAAITNAVVNNEDASSTTLSVNIVKSGGSVAVTNLYASERPVAGITNVALTEIIGVVLEPGDFVSAIAADAGRLNLKLAIREKY